MKVQVSSILWDYPAILTPAAAGPAPAGLAGPATPRTTRPGLRSAFRRSPFRCPWKARRWACRWPRRWGRDDALVAVAAQLETQIGPPMNADKRR